MQGAHMWRLLVELRNGEKITQGLFQLSMEVAFPRRMSDLILISGVTVDKSFSNSLQQVLMQHTYIWFITSQRGCDFEHG